MHAGSPRKKSRRRNSSQKAAYRDRSSKFVSAASSPFEISPRSSLATGLTLGWPPRIAGMASLQKRASQHVLLKIGLERRGERVFAHPEYAVEGPMAWFEGNRDDRRPENDL